MALVRGKIVYTPPETVALNLSGGEKWLSLASALFNAGVEDFGIDCLLHLFEPDDDICFIASKGPLNLDGQRGWQFFYSKVYKCLGLNINDGQAHYNTFLSAENSVPAYGQRYLLAFALDRDGEPWFAVNDQKYSGLFGAGEFGAGDWGAGGSANPADYDGSLDNDEPLRIGGFDGSNRRLKCYLDFIRFDFGRAINIDWYKQEWDRVRYGYSRDDDDFRSDCFAAWNFQNTLLDLVAAYELTVNGGAALYAAGWPHSEAPLTVPFEHNYKWGDRQTYLEQADFARTLNATAQSYLDAARKQNPKLDFENISHAQMTALMAAHLSGNEVALYLRADWRRTCRGLIRKPPEFASMAGREGQAWRGSLEVEAV